MSFNLDSGRDSDEAGTIPPNSGEIGNLQSRRRRKKTKSFYSHRTRSRSNNEGEESEDSDESSAPSLSLILERKAPSRNVNIFLIYLSFTQPCVRMVSPKITEMNKKKYSNPAQSKVNMYSNLSYFGLVLSIQMFSD